MAEIREVPLLFVAIEIVIEIVVVTGLVIEVEIEIEIEIEAEIVVVVVVAIVGMPTGRLPCTALGGSAGCRDVPDLPLSSR